MRLLQEARIKKRAMQALNLFIRIAQNIIGIIEMDLFWTVVLVIVVLWLLGVLWGGLGSIVHILLVIALIIIVYRLWKGQNVVTGK
jgi:hypothetical protein